MMKLNVHYEKTITIKRGEEVTLRTEYVGAEEHIDFYDAAFAGLNFRKVPVLR